MLDAGAVSPLVVGSLANVPQGGFAKLPAKFGLHVDNELPLSIVFARRTSHGATASLVRPDLFARAGIIAPNTNLRLALTLATPSSRLGVNVSVTSPKAIAVNVIGDAILGSLSQISLADINALFAAASGTPGPLISAIKNKVIDKFLTHEISTPTAIARLSKLLSQLALKSEYRKWFLKHLGKSWGPLGIAKAAVASARVIGAYLGLANARVPGQHTLTVSLTPIPPFHPSPGTIYRNRQTGASGLFDSDGSLHPIADGGTYDCLTAQGITAINISPADYAGMSHSPVAAACSPTMTFDDQDGNEITDQYAGSNGVVFSSPQGAYVQDDSANPTSPVIGPDGFIGQLTFSLVSSTQESDPALATTIEFDLGYIDDDGVEITWYDAAGNELGQMTADDLGIDHIVLTNPQGITTVTLDTSNDTAGAAIDNLLFY